MVTASELHKTSSSSNLLTFLHWQEAVSHRIAGATETLFRVWTIGFMSRKQPSAVTPHVSTGDTSVPIDIDQHRLSELSA
jgi:hypothetical protein